MFSTWDWLTIWWKYFGKDKRLIVLLAEENDKLIGIAPLMYSVHSMFGLRQGKIEFIGNGIPIYSDFLIKNQYTKCLDMFYEYLESLQENWSCIDLTDIPANSACLSALNVITKEVKPLNVCLYASLPDTYEGLLRNIKRKDRKELRRTVRRLTEKGLRVDFVDYSDESSVAKGMNNLFLLNQKRWMARGQQGAFGKKHMRDFHLEIARNFSRKGWLGLYCLEVSGKAVAALYGFKYNSKYYAYLTGMDPDYSRFGVGNILFVNAMAKCIEEKFDEFDFIWGSDPYKWRLNAMARWNCKALIHKRGTFSYVKNILYTQYFSNGVRIKYFWGKSSRKSAYEK